MIPNIFEVTVVGVGSLFVMPRPSLDWLKDEIQYYKSIEVDMVVSLLESHEARELGLVQEKEFLEEQGIEFISYQIKDHNLPKAADFGALVKTLHSDLESGKNIAIHCRAGIGRTGVLASCILILDGFKARTAIDMVSAARGVAIPDTEEQFDYICSFEGSIGT